jgi:hypothetical protein
MQPCTAYTGLFRITNAPTGRATPIGASMPLFSEKIRDKSLFREKSAKGLQLLLQSYSSKMQLQEGYRQICSLRVIIASSPKLYSGNPDWYME